jgi:hypothetical protein
MKPVLRRAAAAAVLLLAGILAASCSGKKLNPLQSPNILPVVRVTSSPIDTNAVCTPDPARSCYSLTLEWVGYDADGRVDHFLYAVDPPDEGDTTWIATTDNEKRLVFDAPSRSPRADSLTTLRGFHVFVIAAVDNEGSVGPRMNRAFFSFTTAPEVTIDNPKPIKGVVRTLPPSVRISWSGKDFDGVFTTKPVRYKYLLLGPGNESSVVPGGIAAIFASGGTAIRRYYAPEFRADQGWVATSGETTSVQFTDLVPSATYLFTVVAFDEAGAYSPVFLFEKNIIRFTVKFAAGSGPKLTVFNESFFYEAPASFNPANEVRIEVPANTPVTFNWFAVPPPGADISAYRWMLDGDVFDNRDRENENTDLKRWSTPSASALSATVGPFTGGDHFFYVQVADNTGFQSLATIHFFVVAPSFSKPLLIVDDTRYEADGFLANGNKANYGRPWPSAAELDTLLYAKGGYAWTYTNPPINSPPGMFHGYEFDTIGTRTGIADLSVKLAKLGEYRHVIWLVDLQSAQYASPGNVSDQTMTALRYMSSPGRLNALGAYVRMGGEVWLVGGGGAAASLIPYDDPSNNGLNDYIWNSSNTSKRELAPGRFMYDEARWQSVVRARSGVSLAAQGSIIRSLGRFRFNPGVYAGLPESFDKRTLALDPPPPFRLSSTALYYPTTYTVEFLNSDNIITEPVLGEPVDFKIDAFDDPTPAPVLVRWPTSDTLNTVVSQSNVTAAGATKAAVHALKISTQGGGASAGDLVTRDFGGPRDWSGLSQLQFNMKQDQPASSVQWRVRAIDTKGASASALVDPVATGTFVDVKVKQVNFVPDPSSPFMIDWLLIRKLQLEVARDAAPGNTEFDNVEVVTFPEGPVLDTLLAARLVFTVDPPISATMTVYHGHDFAKPFIFTGFTPWGFRLGQAQQLFDFVLQKMWGMSRTSGTFASFAPAHQLTRRTAGAGVSGAGLRQFANPGAIERRNGKP